MRFKISAMAAGMIIAATSVLAQVLFTFAPPEAYGICLVCHGRDLFAQIGRAIFSTPIEMSEIAREGPIVTVFGILIGAFIAAKTSGEFRFQWVESKWFAFIVGAVVAICALIVSGCPMRILIRTAYGELNALFGLIALILGCIVGTLLLKYKGRGGKKA
ncbi:MAG: YeeE/YedE thiosulfate transporter family protein [Clostridia bacterium]|nr:YeeE/YedE thiosulfate transporter family protein [Clostridia bacterium]